MLKNIKYPNCVSCSYLFSVSGVRVFPLIWIPAVGVLTIKVTETNISKDFLFDLQNKSILSPQHPDEQWRDRSRRQTFTPSDFYAEFTVCVNCINNHWRCIFTKKDDLFDFHYVLFYWFVYFRCETHRFKAFSSPLVETLWYHSLPHTFLLISFSQFRHWCTFYYIFKVKLLMLCLSLLLPASCNVFHVCFTLSYSHVCSLIWKFNHLIHVLGPLVSFLANFLSCLIDIFGAILLANSKFNFCELCYVYLFSICWCQHFGNVWWTC